MGSGIRFKHLISRGRSWAKEESVLVIALLLAFISCFWITPKLSHIDFKVLVLLFNLMLVIGAFKSFQLLDYIAVFFLKKSKNSRQTLFILASITFISSMFMTNDVALLTFVPLTLIVGRRLKTNVLQWVVIETLAANLGSSLTPMGNPQNIFIYAHYRLKLMELISVTGVLALGAIVFLAFLINRQGKKDIAIEIDEIKLLEPKKLLIYLVLFTLVIGSVIGAVDYRIVFIIVGVVTLVVKPKLLIQVDYSLLLTFVSFFIFVGNMGEIQALKDFLQGLLSVRGATFGVSVLLSQGISNVPATMLLAPFTDRWQELLLGVNIGGMGTLIASLASVISYKLYVKQYPVEAKSYFGEFSKYNLLGLAIFIPLFIGIVFMAY